MCSENFPKEFEKVTEVLPFTKYGLSSLKEFKEAEKDIHNLELLKKAGLTHDEIKIYEAIGDGRLDQCNIESNVKKDKLNAIYNKIHKLESQVKSSDEHEQPSTSDHISQNNVKQISNVQRQESKFYPEGHPMNSIKDIEENMFQHLKDDAIISIAKRRHILRRLDRKKERILARQNQIDIELVANTSKVDRPGSLWDMKEIPQKQRKQEKPLIGPKKQTKYTVKDNKIVRLEPINQEKDHEGEYRAVDIVMPVNNAEVQLLEGTKMNVDDIRKIERFKDYEPGAPSKTLFLKNISTKVTQEQLSLLFNQFILANGGPVVVRLMTGQMRGQAFVNFLTENLAIQALEEVNGTIMNGQPVIAVFGRNTNQLQDNT